MPLVSSLLVSLFPLSIFRLTLSFVTRPTAVVHRLHMSSDLITEQGGRRKRKADTTQGGTLDDGKTTPQSDILLQLGPIQQGCIVARPSKTIKSPYVADISLFSGNALHREHAGTVMAHAPSLDCAGMVVPDAEVFCTRNRGSDDDSKAKKETKTLCTIQLCQELRYLEEKQNGDKHSLPPSSEIDHVLVGYHPTLAETISTQLLKRKLLQPLFGSYDDYKAQQTMSTSRVDFVLSHDAKRMGSCDTDYTAIEVKNVVCAEYKDANWVPPQRASVGLYFSTTCDHASTNAIDNPQKKKRKKAPATTSQSQDDTSKVPSDEVSAAPSCDDLQASNLLTPPVDSALLDVLSRHHTPVTHPLQIGEQDANTDGLPPPKVIQIPQENRRCALFPHGKRVSKLLPVVSLRAIKHLQHLIDLADATRKSRAGNNGTAESTWRAVLLFVVNRGDCDLLRICHESDLLFAQLLRRAVEDYGVQVLAQEVVWDLQEATSDQSTDSASPSDAQVVTKKKGDTSKRAGGVSAASASSEPPRTTDPVKMAVARLGRLLPVVVHSSVSKTELDDDLLRRVLVASVSS